MNVGTRDRDVRLDRFVHDGHNCNWCRLGADREAREVSNEMVRVER